MRPECDPVSLGRATVPFTDFSGEHIALKLIPPSQVQRMHTFFQNADVYSRIGKAVAPDLARFTDWFITRRAIVVWDALLPGASQAAGQVIYVTCDGAPHFFFHWSERPTLAEALDIGREGGLAVADMHFAEPNAE